jgi:hypothetical protein
VAYRVKDPTDSGKVVSLTHRQPFTPQKHYFAASDTHLCQRLSELLCLVLLEGLDKLIKIIHIIWSRTRDLPACSIVL